MFKARTVGVDLLRSRPPQWGGGRLPITPAVELKLVIKGPGTPNIQ
jgi:hypothetical protein